MENPQLTKTAQSLSLSNGGDAHPTPRMEVG